MQIFQKENSAANLSFLYFVWKNNFLKLPTQTQLLNVSSRL